MLPMHKIRESFDAKWQRDIRSGCWVWTASTAGKGYGQLRLPGTRRNAYAHRLSYELHVGPIPAGMQVCHRCDNMLCVNPEHLFLGSIGDNIADCIAKDRNARGERNRHATLTEKKALDILTNKKLTRWQLAQKHGIHVNHVDRIRRGGRWAHLQPTVTRQGD